MSRDSLLRQITKIKKECGLDERMSVNVSRLKKVDGVTKVKSIIFSLYDADSEEFENISKAREKIIEIPNLQVSSFYVEL